MKRTIFSIVALVALTMLFLPSCKKEKDPWRNVEAIIKSLRITNGGLSGGDSYTGVIDQDNLIITFDNVAAESNISAIKLEGKFSLGAKLDSVFYNFSNPDDPLATQLKHDVILTNYGDRQATYQVIINLAPAAADPLLDKLVMEDAEGATYTALIDNEEKIVSLSMEGKAKARVNTITVLPARSLYTFSAIDAEGWLSEDTPGTLELNFMGRKTTYTLTFAAGGATGVDFTKAVVHDFSAHTGNVPGYNVDNQVRGSDFDGEYVLVVSREGAATPTPRVYRVADLLQDVAAPTLLSVEGVTGGTHVVSAGRLSHGHIYICNLATNVTDETGTNGPLRVYHYASVNAQPEVVLEWNGYFNDEYTFNGRLGDNISINLDEGGNGYAYFCKQEPGDKVYRFTVTNFTSFTEPTEFDLETPSSYYGQVNEVPSDPGYYLFTSSYVPMVWLYNKDMEEQAAVEFITTEEGAQLKHGVDPRIVMFNKARYMMFTVSNSQNMHWNFGPCLYIMDITDGFNTVAAMTRLEDRLEDEENPFEPDYSYLLTDNDETGTQSGAWSAQCNATEVNGKLVVYSAAPNAGFALIEFPKAK